ncbi:hypothetical protein BGW80DRAFT_1253366 [Lactifluus volemus]|nr:hypothetical protein BGW80DRAFT_1253366 [Lactifluus volemus]
MEEPNNDIDTETLQAKIDLSMAYAQNLVTSWLPSTSGSLTQSSSRAAKAEAELQYSYVAPHGVYLIFLTSYMQDVYSSPLFFFLGARLGVGAPLPEIPPTAQTRLIQKLEGGKKRSREIENGDTLVKAKEDEEADSEEESRAGNLRKRTRIDPFEPGGKKKKNAVETGTAKGIAVGAAARLAPLDVMAGPGPKRKKKKKKPRIPEKQGGEEHVAKGISDGEERSANHETNIAQSEESLQSLFDEWDGLWKHPQISRDNASGPSSSTVPSDVGASSSLPSPKPLQRSPPTSPIQQPPISPKRTAFPASSPRILNLPVLPQ